MVDIPYLLIASVALVAIASPGPATLAILGTSMAQGRRFGLALAAGVMTGSLFWSVSAAFGLGALMYSQAWMVEVLRYLGAGYLFYLSYKSMRSAIRPESNDQVVQTQLKLRSTYMKGLLIHLTNPKAIFFFGSLYALVISPEAGAVDLFRVILAVGSVSMLVFFGYAIVFSIASVRRLYLKLRRWLESAMALLFGLAGFRVLLKIQ